MSDDATYEDDSALAAEYALGLLPPDEARAVEARLAEDARFADLVRDWETHFTDLTHDIPPEQPPTRVLAALRGALFADQQERWWQRLGLVPALLGATAAGLIAFFALQYGLIGPTTPEPDLRASIAAEDNSLVVAALYFDEPGILALERTAGGPRPGRDLELWLIPEGQAPVSLGVLPADRIVTVELTDELRQVLAGGTLAISDEPLGGSPTGAPTGDVLAAAPITEL